MEKVRGFPLEDQLEWAWQNVQDLDPVVGLRKDDLAERVSSMQLLAMSCCIKPHEEETL